MTSHAVAPQWADPVTAGANRGYTHSASFLSALGCFTWSISPVDPTSCLPRNRFARFPVALVDHIVGATRRTLPRATVTPVGAADRHHRRQGEGRGARHVSGSHHRPPRDRLRRCLRGPLTTKAGDDVIAQVSKDFSVTGTQTGGGHGDNDGDGPAAGRRLRTMRQRGAPYAEGAPCLASQLRRVLSDVSPPS